MHIAKIFKNGRSQAVRIPKDFAYEGVTELTVQKVGEKLILEPVRKSWLTLYDEIEPLGAGDDFLADRPDLFAINENRVKFAVKLFEQAGTGFPQRVSVIINSAV